MPRLQVRGCRASPATPHSTAALVNCSTMEWCTTGCQIAMATAAACWATWPLTPDPSLPPCLTSGVAGLVRGWRRQGGREVGQQGHEQSPGEVVEVAAQQAGADCSQAPPLVGTVCMQ